MAIVDLCVKEGLKDVYIHAFTDGRDTDPKSGLGFIRELQAHLDKTVGSHRHRQRAVFCHGPGQTLGKGAACLRCHGAGERGAIDGRTGRNRTILPWRRNRRIHQTTVIIGPDRQPLRTIRDGDFALCFNFRTDRCREITEVLTQKDIPEQDPCKNCRSTTPP